MEYVVGRRRRFLSYNDRIRLETLLHQGLSMSAIARALGVSTSTVSREYRRGLTQKLLSTHYLYDMVDCYSADVAQKKSDFEQTAKGRPEKIGKRFDYLEALSALILNESYSPSAAIAAVKRSTQYGAFSVCPATLYKYIKLHYLPGVTYSKLPQGHYKPRKGSIRRANSQYSLHRNIEARNKEILQRQEFGHWELDSVIGSCKGKCESVLVFTERKTRLEIVLKASDKNARATVDVMKYLKHYFGRDFGNIFKTITCDNGAEFSDQSGLDAFGAIFFTCHPNCPMERGSNENANKLVRRHFLKYQSLAKVNQADCKHVTSWINNYPRRLFGWQTSNDMFAKELASANIVSLPRIIKFFDLKPSNLVLLN